MKEREISLIDLFTEILLHWRSIIICMLVGGVLMGAFSYVRSYRAEQAQLSAIAQEEQELQKKEDSEITLKELREELTELQCNSVDTVLNYEGYILDRQSYLENSVLMQLDAQNEPRVKLTFLVEVANADTRATDVVRIYEDMVSAGLLEWLEKRSEGEYTMANYSEIVCLARNSRDLDEGGNSFSVNVLHMTEEKCNELADWVEEYMAQREAALQEQLGTHTIAVVDRSFMEVYDGELVTNQRNFRNELNNFRASVAKWKDEFTEEEEDYYNLLKGVRENLSGTEEEDAGDEMVVIPASVSLRQVIVGMVLFVGIYVFCVFMRYIFNGKLRTYDDVKALYGIPQLALVPVATEKKFLGIVDMWILKLRNSNKRVFSEEEAIGLASVAVKMAAKKGGVDEICCIGCDVNERTENISEQMRIALEREKISLTLLNNVLYNQEAMERLLDAKAVVLLERAGGTLYSEISKELELLQRQEIKVLGAIVVE